jgi:hypothetical protein
MAMEACFKLTEARIRLIGSPRSWHTIDEKKWLTEELPFSLVSTMCTYARVISVPRS